MPGQIIGGLCFLYIKHVGMEAKKTRTRNQGGLMKCEQVYTRFRLSIELDYHFWVLVW